MNPINPFETNDFQCHSKFRPPEIEAIEFKARRVWPDWDDFPPYQDQQKEIVIKQSSPDYRNENYSILNERTKKRYNMEIKKTQDEIEEMTKRFRLYDYYNFEPKNTISNDQKSFEFFTTNQNQVKFEHNTQFTNAQYNNTQYNNFYNISNDNNYNSKVSNFDYYNNNRNNSFNQNFENNTRNFNNNLDINTQRFKNDDLYYQSQQMNISSHSLSGVKGNYSQSYIKGDDVDYEITAAATLEAGLLREQNEAMRKRINYLKQKLEAQKNENRKALKKIEASEIDRHRMIDYLNNSKNKSNVL